jgi:fumarate hydratase subunit beta
MSEMKRITTPLTPETIESLRAGDQVLITGQVYAARDAAHARLVALLDEGKELPFDIRGQVIYYVGPTPAKPGKVIGSAGPTTSTRMDAYSPRLMEVGLKGMIGKGSRSQGVRDAMKKHKAVYFAAVGGAAALIARRITGNEIVAWEELGPEAIRRLTVVDLPAHVINDIHGGDLYEEGRARYRVG